MNILTCNSDKCPNKRCANISKYIDEFTIPKSPLLIMEKDENNSIIPRGKEWRMKQKWFVTGRSNECENMQIATIISLLGCKLYCRGNKIPKAIPADKELQIKKMVTSIPNDWELKIKTYSRFYKYPIRRANKADSNTVQFKQSIKIGDYGSEDFDALIIVNGITYYFNLKFIVESGGAQDRSYDCVSRHIESQKEYLDNCSEEQVKSIYFINILDGEYAKKCIKNEHRLIQENSENENLKMLNTRLFIGDSPQFELSDVRTLLTKLKA